MSTTLRVSLPDGLKRFVDSHVHSGEYASASDFIREILRERQTREEIVQRFVRDLKKGKRLRRSETIRIG